MAVPIIALVVAASGSAVAATALVNGDSLIKKNSLSGNRSRNRSVPGSKIKVSSLGTVPSATHASKADTATNTTNAAAAAISKVTYVSTTVAVGTSGPAAATITCPAGIFVIRGGAQVADTTNGFVNDSYPAGKSGWSADFASFASTNGTFTAICAPAATTPP